MCRNVQNLTYIVSIRKKISPANKIYRLPGHIFVFDKSQAVIPYVPEFIVYLPPVYKPDQYVNQVRNLN